ncbi:hypothetical protein QFC21_006329 [Naganishia friedmannii]|uniref:Uncharacterized protein n=1 Tax=Naganishia friedmannii TaxID=89922 RepID=A0ACC2V3Q3_9TREE|nr:hypothetical protein QFC21_006329 [Naganishia friedmannii]
MTPVSDYRSFPQPATGDLTSPALNATTTAPMNTSFWIAPAQRMGVDNMPMYSDTPAMEYIGVPGKDSIWESRQPGKKSKRGESSELSKEEGLMGAVERLSDQNLKLQEQLKHVVFQLHFWHDRELTKCNEKRAKMGSPLYETFDAMVRCDNDADRRIFSVPYFQVQPELCMQSLDTRQVNDAHSGSGSSISDELQDDDEEDEGDDVNYSPTAHRKQPYRHSTIKSKSSDSSLLLYPATGNNNRASTSSSSSSRPSSSGSASSTALRGKKPSTRGHVSSPPGLDPVTEESAYTMAQSEKNLYHRYSQMSVTSDDSYFAADAPSSSGYA